MADILTPSVILQMRGDTKAVMEQVNPMLKRREVAVETDTGRLKVGDGEHSWNNLPYSGGGTSSSVIESHTLTPSEIEAKGFDLANKVAAGKEDNVLLFVLGVLQEHEQDYVVSGSHISWVDKGMAEIDFREGDKFQISYEKE